MNKGLFKNYLHLGEDELGSQVLDELLEWHMSPLIVPGSPITGSLARLVPLPRCSTVQCFHQCIFNSGLLLYIRTTWLRQSIKK